MLSFIYSFPKLIVNRSLIESVPYCFMVIDNLSLISCRLFNNSSIGLSSFIILFSKLFINVCIYSSSVKAGFISTSLKILLVKNNL